MSVLRPGVGLIAPDGFWLLTQKLGIFARKPSSDIPPSARLLNPSDTKVHLRIQMRAHLAESYSIFSRNTEMRTIMGHTCHRGGTPNGELRILWIQMNGNLSTYL